jgi:hypothetical protein
MPDGRNPYQLEDKKVKHSLFYLQGILKGKYCREGESDMSASASSPDGYHIHITVGLVGLTYLAQLGHP